MPSRTERLAPGSAHHELVDHTSEVTLRVRAPSFPALVAEATRAFGELVPDSIRRTATETSRQARVSGADREALLVAWLNEVIYWAEVEHWLAEEVRASFDGSELMAEAKGAELSRPFVLVKAATLHGASIREADGALEVEVTLDI